MREYPRGIYIHSHTHIDIYIYIYTDLVIAGSPRTSRNSHAHAFSARCRLRTPRLLVPAQHAVGLQERHTQTQLTANGGACGGSGALRVKGANKME